MTDTSDRDGLSPLARALSSVFDETDEDDVGSAPAPTEASSDGDAEVREPTAPDPVDTRAEDAGAALKAAISAYLTSSEGDPRDEAAEALRQAYSEARASDLVDELADALSALARLGGSRPAALELARDLATPDVVRQLVIRAVETPAASRADRVRLLRQLGELSVRVLVDEAHRDPAEQIGGLRERRAMVDMLLEIGPDAPQVINEMMEDDRWYVVRNGVQVLGEAGLSDGLQHLTGTVAHEDARVRRASVVALQQIGGDAAGLLALARLDDEDASVRAAAARAVGALGAERGVRQLLALLDREADDDVIVAACRALGDYRDPSAVTALEKKATGSFFSKSPTEIRIAAYRALAAIGTPKAQQLLLEAANDKDSRVRSAVRASLRPRA
ncbi:MAG TPA: HEAT repeat domain-containing protein [Longimicrobiales bacterium]|nr:HEAT repeat domain-containing protein [Longimicrobiales bacterium]